MLGDTAVAVHPEDERYADLIGKTVLLPLLNREIPIIADEYVDRAFGTGVVKITPAHDFNDFEVGPRHDLTGINILDESGMINENGGPYAGAGALRGPRQRGCRPGDARAAGQDRGSRSTPSATAIAARR